MNDADRRIVEFVRALHEQLRSQPNLEDFLLWWGGSLEYWIHINSTTVGSQRGRATRSEIPYRTRSKPKNAKPAADGLWTKWADGAIAWSDGLGLLLEVKCAPARVEIASMLSDVGRYDLPALAGIDLEQTWAFWSPGEHIENPDWVSYTDPRWREIRAGVTDLWGLAILLVHGPAPQKKVDKLVQTKVSEGICNANRWGSALTPEAIHRLRGICAIDRLGLEKDGAAGSLFAWALPLGRPPKAE